MQKVFALLAAGSVVLPAGARAQPQHLHVTGYLADYQCMMLTLSNDQMREFPNLPPILSEPRPAAPKVGVASVSVIVSSPIDVRDGYTRVLHLDGRPGWIRSEMLKPWVNQNNPRTRCIPAMMSDGRPGFDYSRPPG